jgi:hypothetical protein
MPYFGKAGLYRNRIGSGTVFFAVYFPLQSTILRSTKQGQQKKKKKDSV